MSALVPGTKVELFSDFWGDITSQDGTAEQIHGGSMQSGSIFP